jgi:hypothetical protein
MEQKWIYNERADNSDLLFSSLTAGDAAAYAVAIYSGNLSVISAAAVLTVADAVSYDAKNSLVIDYLFFRPVLDTDELTPVCGSRYLSQIFIGVSPDEMHPLEPPVLFGTDFNCGYPSNRFPPPNFVISTLSRDQAAFVRMKVWEASKGASFEHARAAGSKYGE